MLVIAGFDIFNFGYFVTCSIAQIAFEEFEIQNVRFAPKYGQTETIVQYRTNPNPWRPSSNRNRRQSPSIRIVGFTRHSALHTLVKAGPPTVTQQQSSTTMALFSTLLSASSEPSASTPSSSSIPTLIQLFTSKLITFDENAKEKLCIYIDSHAVLSYQALEVSPPTPEGESKLFQQRRNTANATPTPNLGVWNCCISKNALVDSLLTIPQTATGHYCMTVDLTDPSLVEPSMAVLHEALVRLLIQQPPTGTAGTTSLSQLKAAQFGLAKDGDDKCIAEAEADDHVKISLLLCAIVDTDAGTNTNKDEYKETQAQNLVIYHLRRYAAALNCSLCFVGTGSGNTESPMEVPTIPLTQVDYTWREWISSGKIENFFAPDNHQPDLIESVLLRNAQFAGEWDAAKDSLWKALPSSIEEKDSSSFRTQKSSGDDDWLSQLRDSVATVEAQPQAPRAPAAAAATPKKTEDAAVSSFFENLLKK